MSEARATVYTVAPGAPFLDVVASALAEGALGPHGVAPTPLELAAAKVYLPTRRAGHALARALHRAAGRAILMPAIAGLGEIADEGAAGAFAADPDDRDGFGPAVVSEAERRAVLADIAMAWAASTMRPVGEGESVVQPVPRMPAEATAFAIELAGLIDEMTVAGVASAGLAGAVPDDLSHLARNWAINLDFLTHALERWSGHLAARGLAERVARRDRELRAAAARLAGEGAPGLVIAAGSTGSVPAAAELMAAIARLETGAVILPGLDTGLDEASWRLVGPDHPQFGMKALIESIGITREEVGVLGPERSAPARVRARLASETMRPAGSAEHWVEALAELEALGPDAVRAALAGVSLIEADDEHLEARAIALMLRRAADEPDRLTALVTPDRGLARRVSAELARWGMAIDDSAGQPLAGTVPAVFLRLVGEVAASGFAPVATLALLKHPLALLGLEAPAVRAGARTLEIAVLRGARPAPGIAGIAAALGAADPQNEHHPVKARLTAGDLAGAGELFARLERAFAPLTRLAAEAGPVSAADLVTAHVETAEALAAAPEGGRGRLWAGEAGEALAAFLAEAIAAANHAAPVPLADFSGWLDQLMRGRVVREARAGPANLVIWGPLEARLQQVDRLILAGLNEGVWPSEVQSDPWLGRHMRAALGLDPPERRIGLQAHDVAQALMAPEVVLIRACKSGGTPAVPSRWLWRLTTLLEALGCRDALEPADPWLAWARGLDDGGTAMPCAPPAPAPPLDARPERLSVTRIETWIRDPYAIYASQVLKLAPLDRLDLAPDAADYGTLIHEALARLLKACPAAPLPADALDQLLKFGEEVFEALDHRPGLRAYWWTRFERIARWFVDEDGALRAPGTASSSEITGRMEIAAPGRNTPFTLTARADRIDIDGGGRAVIVDYKTGRPPSDRQILQIMAPQMPLEAAILAAGGFANIEQREVRALVHLALSGREPPGEAHFAPDTPGALAEDALGRLTGLVAAYANPVQPYRSRVAPFREDFAGDYDHLARVGEWSLGSGGGHDG